MTLTKATYASAAIFLFVVLTLTSSAQTLTASEAIQRIQKYYPAVPTPGTVDTVKAGDRSTPVTGIATTFLDTMDVLREASRRGANLVITHEPTFYNHLDETDFFASDPVYREKLDFIQQHHMVVFRLHDAIHTVVPDPMTAGLMQELGWQRYVDKGSPSRATIPPTKLVDLSREMASKLNARMLRVVGNPNDSITRVALLPGAAGTRKQIEILRRDDVEALIIGEVPEWETVEYVRDASAQGRLKALIMVGHEVSEEAGMEQCAEDLRTLFPKVPVIHIPAAQPTWSPANPPASPAKKLQK